MTPRILSIVFMLLLSTTWIVQTGCRAGEEAALVRGRAYYDIYDEAVNLYFKPPYRKEQAVGLMRSACEYHTELQDASCYNLGILLEIHGQPDQALEAYKRAQSLNPHQLYALAIQRLGGRAIESSSDYLKFMSQIVEQCRAEDREGALLSMRRMMSVAVGPGHPITLHREMLDQPFLQSCLGDSEQYQQYVSELPANSEALDEAIYRERAAVHPFHGLWDMELYLRNLQQREQSHNRITADWQNVLQATRNAQGNVVARELRAMFQALDTYGRRSQIDGQKALAIKRAAAILLQNDPYFARVRGNAAIQSVIAPILR
ncbi:MAG: tetratricopeptide repeat protein [Leptospiraceae bacterium]|nr:tetratricopeptide repeat protein [Leptospiraceae bacterium]